MTCALRCPAILTVLSSLAIPALAIPALAMPPGFVDSTQASELRPTQMDYDDGDFTLAIHRDFTNMNEERLLGIAESTYPARDEVISLSVVHRTEIGPDTTGIPLWWYDGVGVHRVPYAATAGALDYYLDLTRRMRSHNFWGAFARSLFWTDLNYRASVAHYDAYFVGGEEYRDVYVAKITLGWGYDEGTFVPVNRAHRVVVLKPDGEVLSIDGDGTVQETVGFSVHRGIGYRKQLMR